MQLKTASAIVIASLSLGALLNLTSTILTRHWALVILGVKTPWYSQFASLLGVLIFNGPLILFFVVLYRNQTKSAMPL